MPPLKIGILLSQPLDYSIGTDIRILSLAKALRDLGIDVLILSPFPLKVNYVRGIPVYCIFNDFLGVFRLAMNIAKEIMKYKSRYNILSQIKIMTKLAKIIASKLTRIVDNLDLSIIQAEQEFAALVCSNIRSHIDIPIVVDFHGIWPEELIASNIIKRGSQDHINILKLERYLANNTDIIVVVSEEMRDYVIDVYEADPNIVYVIPNATFPRQSRRLLDYRADTVVYAGTVTFRENVPLLINSLSIVKDKFPKVRLYITNRGDALSFLKRQFHKRGVKPCYYWFDNAEEFYRFLTTCHVGVIPALKHIWRQMATPAKLYDYLSAGVPVVAVDIGASWNEIIRKRKVGILTDDDPQSFAEGILELLHDPELIYEYGNRAIELVKKELNYWKSAEKLLKIYKKLG